MIFTIALGDRLVENEDVETSSSFNSDCLFVMELLAFRLMVVLIDGKNFFTDACTIWKKVSFGSSIICNTEAPWLSMEYLYIIAATQAVEA